MQDTKTLKLAPLTASSRIVLRDFTIHREARHGILVANLETASFIEIDEQTVSAMDALRSNASVHEAQRKLQKQSGVEFDVRGLAEALRARGFVESVDGQPCTLPPKRVRHPFLKAVPLSSLRWLHSRVFFYSVASLVACWFFLLLSHPQLWPQSSDMFVWNQTYRAVGLILAGLLAVAYLHELGHFFMARSFGIDAFIHVSPRLLAFVLKTDVTNAWVLPASKRIWIFLAGIGVNLFLASTAGLLAAAFQLGWLEGGDAWVRPLRFFVAINLLPLIYQLFIFARTDLYYVVGAVAGERNLAADSMAYLRYRLRRVLRRRTSPPAEKCFACPAALFDDDPFCPRCGTLREVEDPNKYPFRPQSRPNYLVFGVLALVGRAATFLVFLLLALPFLFQLLQQSVQSLQEAWAAADMTHLFLDSVVLAAVFAQLWASLYYLINSTLARASAARRRQGRQS